MGELSFRTLFSALNASGCRYVIVGGLAVILHGHARLTTDTDLVVDLAAGELSDFLSVLGGLGFKPRVPVELQDFADAEKRNYWQREKGMQVFSVFHPDQPRWVIDLFVNSPLDFSRLVECSVSKQIETVEVRVASVDDLIEMKRMAGREIDRTDIEWLEQIKEVVGEYRV